MKLPNASRRCVRSDVAHLTDAQIRQLEQAERRLLAPIEREAQFQNRVELLVWCLYASPCVFFGLTAITRSGPEAGLFEWAFVWRVALAVAFGLHQNYAMAWERGLWYALSLWRQSLNKRRSQVELDLAAEFKLSKQSSPAARPYHQN